MLVKFQPYVIKILTHIYAVLILFLDKMGDFHTVLNDKDEEIGFVSREGVLTFYSQIISRTKKKDSS
jgi:hypothetical protein